MILVLLSPAGASAASAAAPQSDVTVTYVPADGTWTGTNGFGRAVSFTVSNSGTTWTMFSVDWGFTVPGCTGSGTTGNTGPGAITSNNFSKDTSTISFTGHFTSAYTATGTYGLELNTICGHLSESGSWTASVPMPPPGSFAKTAPAEGTTVMTLQPTLRWGASANASGYQYCYNTDTSCTTWKDVLTGTSVQLSGLSPLTTYYWQVRATNSGGTTYADGSESALRSFTTGAISKKIYRSRPTHDGWVLESTETSGTGGSVNTALAYVMVGDNASRRQYRAILSFDTSSLSETAIITSVTLKIKKAGSWATNPFGMLGNLVADINTGPLGGNSALQLSDFAVGASKPGVLSIPNTPSAGWYARSLGAINCGYINRAGLTQFRLRFAKDDDNDSVADYAKFYSGDATTTSYRPMLVIEYYEP